MICTNIHLLSRAALKKTTSFIWVVCFCWHICSCLFWINSISFYHSCYIKCTCVSYFVKFCAPSYHLNSHGHSRWPCCLHGDPAMHEWGFHWWIAPGESRRRSYPWANRGMIGLLVSVILQWWSMVWLIMGQHLLKTAECTDKLVQLNWCHKAGLASLPFE